MLVCRHFRMHRNVFASCGILYNHESELRSSNFLSKKVVESVVKIRNSRMNKLSIGRLDTNVDWGYAPDYVDAMRRILQVPHPSDYIVASGALHTVRQFVSIAFDHVGLDYRKYIVERKDIVKEPSKYRQGDATKLRQDTGWKPSITFDEMVRRLVDYEIEKNPA